MPYREAIGNSSHLKEKVTMNWNRIMIIAVMLCGVLFGGCGEDGREATPTSVAPSISDNEIANDLKIEIQPGDPTDFEAYMAGVAAVLNTPNPDYWIPISLTFSEDHLIDTQPIDGPGWTIGSEVKMALSDLGNQPNRGGTYTYTIYAPYYAQNYGRATVFKFDELPEGCKEIVFSVCSDDLDVPGEDDGYLLNSFVLTTDPRPGWAEIDHRNVKDYADCADMSLVITDYVKPDGNKTEGAVYDPSDPPAGGEYD